MIQWIRNFFGLDDKQETPVVPEPVFTLIEPAAVLGAEPVLASIDPTKPVTIQGDAVITGNLTVQGTTTTVSAVTEPVATPSPKKTASPKRTPSPKKRNRR